MGCLIEVIGFLLLMVAFYLLINFRVIGVLFLLVGCTLIGIGNHINAGITNINQLFANGDIVGKDLKYIESIMGAHSKVDIASNGERIYSWIDGNDVVRLEILCSKKNICKEVLKKI